MTLKLIALLIILLPAEVLAQTGEMRPAKRKSPSIILPNEKEEASVIRQSALTTLDTAIDELPGIDNLNLRIELTQALVKLLRKCHPERCRKALDLLFVKAIEFKDKGSTDEIRRTDPDSAIRKIIEIAAVLDRNLAQSYIKAYTEEIELKAEEASHSRQNNGQLAAIYLRIAVQLVEKDPSLATATATRSLAIRIIPDTLTFLGILRKKDPQLASNFFLAALQAAEGRSGEDVNELLLLYSYVFSPVRVPVVSPRGIGVYSIPGYTEEVQDYAVNPWLAKQYLEVTSKLLMNPDRYLPENLESLTAGVIGDFYFLSIIEPSAAAYVPNLAQAILEHRTILANYLESNQRSGAIAAVERWNNIPKEANLTGSANESTVDYLISKADQASDSKSRDMLYFRAALVALDDKKYERALQLIGKLSSDVPEQARQLIKFGMAARKTQDGQIDEAEELARHDDSLVRRCYIFTLIADSLLTAKSKDISRAAQLLDEVQQLAEKLKSPREKLSVLVGAAAVTSRLDMGRAFALFRETIKSANKVDDFTGDVSIPQSANIGGYLFDFSIYDKEFGFFELVRRLGTNDFYQTLGDAREIQNRALRLHSIITVCATALSKT
ncbi:MAG TPA: hypothetical protein VEM96_16985 [Pyrinomonadaceae bacterium]|nr:hypothetical protein [Pyrinomonadaceae bacterium]